MIVSSHLLTELEAVCDWLIVVDRGGLVYVGPAIGLGANDTTLVLATASHQLEQLAGLIERRGYELVASSGDAEVVSVRVPDDCVATELGRELNAAAHADGIVLHEIRFDRADLEQRYLELVQGPETGHHESAGIRSNRIGATS
jgi:ABC-2 type transport system ATP-binding protein